MEKLSYFSILRLLPALFVGVVVLSPLSSCDDDTPEPKVEYYFTIASKPPDYSEVPKDEMAYVITRIMNDSIKRVYPKPTVEGDDYAVLAVCDRIYYRFREQHPEAVQHFYCVATMHRACKAGSIIRLDTKIRYYDF